MTRTGVRPIPEGYTTLTSYLIAKDADRMLAFLEAAFDAKALLVHRGEKGEIRHAELQMGTAKLMLGQAPEGWSARSATFYLYVEDCDAVHRRAVHAGAKSLGAPQDQPYGDRNGGVEDHEGNSWYIGTRIEDLTEAELRERMAGKG